jgi:hypothetical protein
LRLIKCEAAYDSIKCSKPGDSIITCSKISNIPYNLIFATKFNDFSILITIISWRKLFQTCLKIKVNNFPAILI